MMRHRAWGWLLGLLVLLPTRSQAAEPLRVAAASDLQAAFPALAKGFRESGGVEVSATFGASGQLAEQIKAGAPFDVFLSAKRRSSRGWRRRATWRRSRSGRMPGVARAGGPRGGGRGGRAAGGPDQAGGQEGRDRQPGDRPLRGRGEAGAGAGGALGRAEAEARAGRVGPPGVPVRPVGQRRGRARRPVDRRRSRGCGSSRSTRSFTTRSCKASGSSPGSKRPDDGPALRRLPARRDGAGDPASTSGSAAGTPREAAAAMTMPGDLARSGSRSGSPRWRRS